MISLRSVVERISNHYLARELFWPLEFRIYVFRPMRMTDAILPGLLTILALSSLHHLLAAGQTSQHERAHSLSSLPHILFE